MLELRPLSVAFVEGHPERAAQVLDALPVAESAAFLAASPARLGATVVRHMTPQYAARCVEKMDERALSSLVAALGPQAAAALLQHLAPDYQARVLERLPAGVAVAVRLLVGYARDTAGSCMDPLPLALPGETPVEDALAALKRYDGEPDDVVFVVAPGRRLRGVVAVAGLLRAAPAAALSAVMRQPAPCVPSLTPLAAIRNHPGWLALSALAVIEGQDRLVGALRRPPLEAALAKGLEPAPGDSDVVSGLGGACWEVLASLAQLAVNLAPPIAAVSRRKENEDGR
jgi:magnesium transporter